MKASILASAALALALGACGEAGESTGAEEVADPVDTLLPGNFSITTEVTDLASTDGTTPATNAEVGQIIETSVCVGPDGLLPAAIFGEEGDDCTIENPYQRRGRLRQELVCSREAGDVRLQVQADFTADGVEGDIRSGSYFAGDGDYQMTRTIRGTRTGDCTVEEAEEDLEAEVADE